MFREIVPHSRNNEFAFSIKFVSIQAIGVQDLGRCFGKSCLIPETTKDLVSLYHLHLVSQL